MLAANGRGEPVPQLTALASDLGHLPLALAQAASYLADAQVSCADYRDLLADRTATLRDAAPDCLPDEQALTVAATWSLSIDHADTMRPPGMARPMLHLASVLDGHGIPGAVLTATPIRDYLARHSTHPATTAPSDPEPPHTVSAQDAHLALTALHRVNLIDYAPGTVGATVRVHVLVQRATRDSFEPDQITAVAHAAADALIAAWPTQEPDTDLPHRLRANTAALIHTSGQALIDPDIHPVLLRVGKSLSDTGSVEAAIRHYARLLEQATQRLGDQKPSVLTVRRDLATQRGQHGEVERAVKDMDRLLADQLRLLGPDHPETLATRHELIWWQWTAGDRDGAERDLTTLLADRIRIQGHDHLDTLETRHNLYFAWAEAGQSERALEAYTGLLADRLRLQGPDNSHTVSARHQIAGLQARIKKDLEGAARDMAEVVRDRIRLQGLHHPETMAARQTLARMHGEAGQTQEAVEALRILYDDRVRVLGPDHPDTMTAQGLLAHWTAKAGTYDAALTLLDNLLRDQLRVLGPDSPHTLETRHEIYTLWAETGRAADAHHALADLLSARCRIQGATHYDTQRTRQALDDLIASTVLRPTAATALGPGPTRTASQPAADLYKQQQPPAPSRS